MPSQPGLLRVQRRTITAIPPGCVPVLPLVLPLLPQQCPPLVDRKNVARTNPNSRKGLAMSEPESDPQPVAIYRPDPTAGAVTLFSISRNGTPATLSSFDPTTPAGARLLVQATLLECLQLGEHGNRELHIVDWYAHEAGRTKEDGEFDEWTRVVLFTADGKVYSCGSRGVAKSLAIFAVARNALHFDPPVKCTVQVKKLANAKNWITLVPDLDSLCPSPAKAAGGKGKDK